MNDTGMSKESIVLLGCGQAKSRALRRKAAGCPPWQDDILSTTIPGDPRPAVTPALDR